MAFDLSTVSSFFKRTITAADDRVVLGVDVGSSAIKIVELTEKRGVPTLTTYGELQLGPYGNTDIGRTVRLPVGKLTEAFIDIQREASAHAREAVVAVAYSASFSTIVSLKTTTEDQIAAMVPVEARKYVPVPLNQVALDWFPVSAHAAESETNVLLAAIHLDALKRYEGMVKGANLTSRFTELELFSSIRSVVSQKDHTVALIDLGASTAKLFIVRTGVVGKTHSVMLSATELTASLASALSIPFGEAEVLKRSVGLAGSPDNPKVQATLLAGLERGFRELHHVMVEYEREEKTTIEKVVLSGGGSLLIGLPQFSTEFFARPTEVARPFSKVAFPAFLEDTLIEAGPSFAVAVGAALRGLSTND